MKKVIKLCSLLCAMIVLVALVMTLAMSVTAATEATLTVTPEGGTTETFNGTFQAMDDKVDSLIKANPTVKTEYVITLNSNATMPKMGSFNGNENCYITIDLNGYTLTTAFDNNLWLLTTAVNFTLEGSNDKGEMGKIINHGGAGGLIYIQANATGRNNDAIVANISNLEYICTNMANGYNVVDDPNVNEYPNQPMFHVNAGRTTLTNVKMSYTGENAFAVKGSQGSPAGDISVMKMRFCQISGTSTVIFDGCEFIDTNTKNINTVGMEIAGSAKVALKNTKIVANHGVSSSSTGNIMMYDCDIYGGTAPFDGAGRFFVQDSIIRTPTGVVCKNNGAYSQFRSTGSKFTVIYSDKPLSGKYQLSNAFELVAGEGKYTVMPSSPEINGEKHVASLLVIEDYGLVENVYYSGSYDFVMSKLTYRLSQARDIPIDYILTLHADAEYATAKTIASANTTHVNIRIDLNGHKLSSSLDAVMFNLQANSKGTMHFELDGADPDGKIGEVFNNSLGGSLINTSPSNSSSNNLTVAVNDIKATYTNLAKPASNGDYASVPVIYLSAGKSVHIRNLNAEYNATELVAISDKTLRTPVIKVEGPVEVLVEDSVLSSALTTGKTIGFYALKTATAPITIKNTKISAAYGITCNVTDGAVEVINCDVYGKTAPYNESGYIKVTDTVSRTDGGNIVNTATREFVYFLYGEGKNTFNKADGKSMHIAQDGYTFVKSGSVYVMQPDTSVEATLAINPYGELPTFYTGTFDAMVAKLNKLQPSVRTEYILSLNKDANYTDGATKTFNSNVYCKIDLNGHTLNTTYSNNMFQIVGNYHFEFDGSDKDGKIGKIYHTGKAGAIVYPRANDGLNDNTVISIHDLEMEYTDLSSGFSDNAQYPNQSMINLPAGTITIENVKMNYTGVHASAVEGSTGGANLAAMYSPMINIGGNADVTIIDCELMDTNTKGIQIRGINTAGTKPVKIYNTTISSFNTIYTSGSGGVMLDNCTINANYRAFNGTAPITVIDSAIKTKDQFANANSKVYFEYGTGKTTIEVPSGTQLNGGHSVEAGYYVCATANGKFVISDGTGYSTVSLPNIFASGMVFQRNKDLSVFGYCATEGAKVKVTFNGVEKIATVANGQWKATFDPMSAAKGLTLSVVQQDVAVPVEITYDNIDIGEVWVMGGQSNSQYELYKMEDAEEYIANADNFYNIRVYHATSTTAGAPVAQGAPSKWRQVTSDMLKKESDIQGQVSAIAYVMATRLATELDDNVTVAILDINYNGSGIQTWIEEGIYADYFGDDAAMMTKYDEYKKFWLENGRLPSNTTEAKSYQEKPYNWLPSGNYNAMMAGIVGFEVKGTIWMQGCSNYSSTNYETYYQALMETFRMTFDDDKLPCFVIQLQPYGEGANNDFRAIQYNMTDNDPYSYLVTAATGGAVFCDSDFANNNGDTSLVHPARKSPTGHRLADAILYQMYGFEEYKDAIAPKVTKVEADGNKIIVTFDTEVKTELGTDIVEGFEIAGEDGTFVSANATISGNKIILEANGVTDPKSVRYGYGKFNIELQDGTLVPYDRKTTAPVYTQDYMTIYGPNGEEYTFERGTDIVIRSLFNGNVTNASGHPLPIFKLEVGYVAE